MELLTFAVIGALLGGAVSLFLRQPDGAATWWHVGVGTAGAVLAGTLLPWVIQANAVPGGDTDAPNVMFALTGAAVALCLFRLIRRVRQQA